MRRPKIGIALGSGSARGWSHIGVLEALIEQGIKPDIVCGCSIGSMVGAAYVSDKLAPLKDWVLTLKWSSVARLLRIGISNGGLIDGDVFEDLMVKLDIAAPIETYSLPFAAIATDFETGQEVWLRTGPIHQAVRASMAMPGVFSPAWRDSRWLLDGGLVNPVPVSVCRDLGAEFIIAVNLNSELVERTTVSKEPRPQVKGGLMASLQEASVEAQIDLSNPEKYLSQAANLELTPAGSAPGFFDVLASSIDIMQDKITRSRLEGVQPQIMLTPSLDEIGLFEFHKAQDAIAEGRACVERSMPMLEALR